MKGTVPRTAPPTGPGLFDRPEPRGPRILSVSELTAQLKGAVEPRFRDVWVSGEVAGVISVRDIVNAWQSERG